MRSSSLRLLLCLLLILVSGIASWGDGSLMSTKDSIDTSDSTTTEVLRRAADNFPTLQMGRMVGLVHLAKTMASARGRVDDSHKLQSKKLAETLGYDSDEMGLAGETDEGMFSVAGDTTINLPADKQSSGRGFGWKEIATVAAIILGPQLGMEAWREYKASDPPQQVSPDDREDRDTLIDSISGERPTKSGERPTKSGERP